MRMPRRQPNAVLCYVDERVFRDDALRTAYFTTQALADQWGDDWNDAPYDCNAGCPYGWRATCYGKQSDGTYAWEPNPDPAWRIFSIEFTGPFDTPAGVAFNTPYCVEDINAGKIPWAWTSPDDPAPMVTINAGISVKWFRALVKRAGGTLGETVEMRDA